MAEADYQPSPQSRAVGANELAPPVMPNFQDPGATFLSAFALSAGLAQRRRALELQLAEIQDKSQKDEQNFNLQKQEFAYRQVHDAQTNTLAQKELDLKATRDQVLNDYNKAEMEQAKARTQNLGANVGDYASEIYGIQNSGIPMGSDLAADQFNLIKTRYPDIQGTLAAQRINKEWMAQHTSAAKSLDSESRQLNARYRENLNRQFNTQNWNTAALFGEPVTNEKVWGKNYDSKGNVTSYFQKYDKDTGAILAPTDQGQARTITVPDYNIIQQQRNRLEQIVSGNSGNQPDPAAVQSGQQTVPPYLQKAMKWIQDNPDDPRVPAVKQQLGIQ